jgi:pilus assembly protein CpaE
MSGPEFTFDDVRLGRIAVAMTGSCDGLEALRQGLEEHEGIDFLGYSEQVRDAVPALTPSRLQVVLHATREHALLSKELAAIREHTRAPIVLVSSEESQSLLDGALESRVADVLLLPQSIGSALFTIRKIAYAGRWQVDGRDGGGHLITVFSPKGGTGKTVIATNMAVAVARQKKGKVLLLDLDLQFGDAAVMLGITPERTLHDLVNAPGELDSEKLTGFAARHPAGFDVLAAPLRPDEAEFIPEDKILNLLGVARQSYDTIIVDTAPFFYGPMLATLDNTEELFLVCVPELPTLKNAYVTLKTLELLSFPTQRVRVIMNRSNLRQGLKAKDVESVLGTNIGFELPEDEEVQAALNVGTAVVLANKSAPFSRQVVKLADSLMASAAETNGTPLVASEGPK